MIRISYTFDRTVSDTSFSHLYEAVVHIVLVVPVHLDYRL